MIRSYLEESTYYYTIHQEYERDNLKLAIVSERDPSGKESELYVIYEIDGKLYNHFHDEIGLED